MFRLVLCFIIVLFASCVSAWQSSSSSSMNLKRYFNLQMTGGGRRPLMGGNWKLNPRSVSESIALATEVAKSTKGITDVDVVLFPPHPFLVSTSTKHITIIMLTVQRIDDFYNYNYNNYSNYNNYLLLLQLLLGTSIY